MADSYMKVVLTMRAGLEAIENAFFYRGSLDGGTEPDNFDLTGLSAAFQTSVAPAWIAPLQDNVVLEKLSVTPYKATGEPGGAIPVETPLSGAGGSTGRNRDGNTLVAILKPTLDVLVPLSSAPGLVKKAYWAYGPLFSAAIDDSGALDPAAFPSGSIAALEAAISTTLTYGGVTVTPIKVSFTLTHARTTNIQAYRDVLGATLRSQTSVRVSRKNGR